MLRLWLIFAQATTVAVAALFVVSTFRPEWLPVRTGTSVPVLQTSTSAAPAPSANTYADAVQRAMPSVVNIFSSKEVRAQRHPLLNDPIFRRFFGDQLPDEAQRASSLGSGVIVSTSGYVLTNHHVVEAADEIEVALADGKKLLAKVVGNDPETDLAVLRVNAEDLPAISFGSSEALRVGDIVLAIGNPFGVGQTVTSGIISALGRTGLGINTFENFIQTDAAINPGNSGGALIDANGNLIGINTAIFTRTGSSAGIGFAIPVSTAKMVLDQILTVTGWQGIRAADGPGQYYITGTSTTGSLLYIGAINGQGVAYTVADPAGMLNLIAALAPGQSAKVRLKRQGQDVDATVTVGRRPKPQARAE